MRKVYSDKTDERCEEIALYMLENNATVRKAASRFGISKSTVHTAVTLSNALCGWWRRNHVASNKKRR